MRTVILVPWRGGDARREWCWDMVRPDLERFGWDIYTGDGQAKIWSRAPAVNAAKAQAGDWDLALVADTDTIPDHNDIYRAMDWVASTGGAARPHSERIMLSGSGSIKLMQRGPRYLADDQGDYAPNQWAGGGLLVLTREAWETVGGYDESFVGWGYEDTSINLRLLRQTRWDRLPGRAWHLAHPTNRNRALPASKRKYHAMLIEYADDIAEWARDKGLQSPEKVF